MTERQYIQNNKNNKQTYHVDSVSNVVHGELARARSCEDNVTSGPYIYTTPNKLHVKRVDSSSEF